MHFLIRVLRKSYLGDGQVWSADIKAIRTIMTLLILTDTEVSSYLSNELLIICQFGSGPNICEFESMAIISIHQI